MQLLHRLGLSMVTMSLRSDLDVIGKHFLSEIKSRKTEIEIWFQRRKMIEKIIKGLELRVEFTDDKYIAAIHDLEEEETKHEEKLDLHKPDGYVMELLIKNENDAKAVLDLHLDSRPKLYDVTYDNIDLTVNSSEYLMGQRDNSVHWCSSIIVEDVVDAREICDKEYDRNILRTDFEDRIDLTPAEREHLLFDYVQMVANLIASNWPNLFPDLKKERIKPLTLTIKEMSSEF